MGTSEDARCVYCRTKPVEPAWRPFCSERCKMADLGRWLGEAYRVPAERRDELPDPPDPPDPLKDERQER